MTYRVEHDRHVEAHMAYLVNTNWLRYYIIHPSRLKRFVFFLLGREGLHDGAPRPLRFVGEVY